MSKTGTATMAKTKEAKEEVIDRSDDQKRIKERILSLLGTPKELMRVSVTPIKANSYRVNVYTKRTDHDGLVDVLSARIAHSFFVVERQDELVSEPPIVKSY